MSERGTFGVVRGTLRFKTVKRRRHPFGGVQDSVPSLRMHAEAPRLISWPDAANSRDLQEETRVILSTLTHHEQRVLRMRFGIGEALHCSVEEIARYCALDCGHILEIQAQALRKLRHPGGRPLKSVSRR